MSDGISSRALAFASTLVASALTIVLLVEGRDLLIPLAVAVMIWYLLNALARFFRRIPLGGFRLPDWAGLTLAVVTVAVALALAAEIISGNLAEVSRAAPAYQENFRGLLDTLARRAGFAQPPDIARIVEEIDLRALIGSFAATAASFAGSFGVVLIYVLFLLIEQGSFAHKLNALFPGDARREEIRALVHRIQVQIQTYVAIKTFTSALTGGISYVVLVIVGVDFAGFWGFIIFLLNYIPTIGSLLGIVLPTLLAIVQFAAVGPVLAVLIGVGATQIVIGNLVEPRMMGTSLNISPLVVLVSLAVWGSLWGLAGMFLSVPLTMIAMIIFSYFGPTRPVAILLSADGRIEPLTEVSVDNEEPRPI